MSQSERPDDMRPVAVRSASAHSTLVMMRVHEAALAHSGPILGLRRAAQSGDVERTVAILRTWTGAAACVFVAEAASVAVQHDHVPLLAELARRYGAQALGGAEDIVRAMQKAVAHGAKKVHDWLAAQLLTLLRSSPRCAGLFDPAALRR